MLPDTIDSLVHKGMPTVFYITGGGSSAIPELLQHGGGSAFFLEARIPYDNQCVQELLGGHAPDRFCDSPTSRMLAIAAYHRASQLIGNPDVVGVGATAKLQLHTDEEREGRQHAIHVSVHGKNRTRNTSLLLMGNGTRSRAEEEQVTTDMIVKEYCAFLEVPCFPPSLYSHEKVATHDVTSLWSLDNTHLAQVLPWHCCGDSPLKAVSPVIFSGSFNPVHDGHIKIAEMAYEKTGKPVWFEISLTNCSKPNVDWVSLQERVDSFNQYRDNMAIAGFVFTNEPMFVQKARLFTRPIFLVGRDTIARTDTPRFYGSITAYSNAINELVSRGVQFLVFDRKGSIPVPYRHIGMEKICTTVNDYVDAGENSTDVRKKNEKTRIPKKTSCSTTSGSSCKCRK